MRALIIFALALPGFTLFAGEPETEYNGQPEAQYHYRDILIPAFRDDEPKISRWSVSLANNYLRNGALAWKRDKNCVACHTTGAYLVTLPALTPQLGKPLDEIRDLFIAELRTTQRTERREVLKTRAPARMVYIAAGLAEWDLHVAKHLSPETREALALMFDLQLDDGSWSNAVCWPPYESDEFHLATQAAMAVSAAPGWLEDAKDLKLLSHVRRLKNYLRHTRPPHDYGGTLLLWAAARMPDLLPASRRDELIEMIWKHQLSDGGWSIRTFATPEEWGRGNRAAKLRGEPDFANPASDGHQTGLAIIVLRTAGVNATDSRIQRGIQWLKTNQRSSGRWWTRSLNTDDFQFISYSGTAFPLLALGMCGEIPISSVVVSPPALSGAYLIANRLPGK